MLSAIQQGIITPSTKQRMDELESRKSELMVQIGKEEMARPMLTKDQIVFWFHRFRKLDTNKLEHQRQLIDSFVNAIFLYDDKMIITFNYKDGTKTITFFDLERSELSSDINGLGETKQKASPKGLLFVLPTGLERWKKEMLLREHLPAVGFSPF